MIKALNVHRIPLGELVFHIALPPGGWYIHFPSAKSCRKLFLTVCVCARACVRYGVKRQCVDWQDGSH